MGKKSKLSNQQKRRISQNQQQRRQRAKSSATSIDDANLLPEEHGLLIRRYGAQADIENASGELMRCQLRRNLGEPVAGDNIVWRRYANNQDDKIAGVIVAIEPRSSELKRPVPYEGLKPIAANIDQLLVVNANPPGISFVLLDRYLVAAAWLKLPAVILFNKADGYSDNEYTQLKQFASLYQDLGYQVIFTSAKSEIGLESLQTQMQEKTSIFVGQSGVGKSSLINALLGPNVTEVQQVSETSGLGMHTTTAACLYHLHQGGRIIDSPGIREFGLEHMEHQQVLSGFNEFSELQHSCKYRNCTHQHEPGCAIQQAVSDGKIHPSRYQSYLSIVETLGQ